MCKGGPSNEEVPMGVWGGLGVPEKYNSDMVSAANVRNLKSRRVYSEEYISRSCANYRISLTQTIHKGFCNTINGTHKVVFSLSNIEIYSM